MNDPTDIFRSHTLEIPFDGAGRMARFRGCGNSDGWEILFSDGRLESRRVFGYVLRHWSERSSYDNDRLIAFIRERCRPGSSACEELAEYLAAIGHPSAESLRSS
jgi:hypothetical protein